MWILWTIVIGFVAGVLAKFLTPVSISPVESGPLPFEASEPLG